MEADSSKGWTFTFSVDGLSEDENPVRVVIVGEVGDPTENMWWDSEALFYLDDNHAGAIAADTVTDKYQVGRDALTLLETRDFHPDDLLGLEEVDIGVWI